MSRAIFEKIRLIRERGGLSRVDFAAASMLPSRTLEAIENRGSVPRADVLEKICQRFPEYTFYLMGILDKNVKQIDPEQNTQTAEEWKILQNLSMTDCELNKCCIKPEWFEKIMMIEASDEINTLICIVVLKKIDESEEKICIKIGSEDFHFTDKSGQNKLDRLRNWFGKIERNDLIKTAELYYSNTHTLESLYKTKILSSSTLKKGDDLSSFSFRSSRVFSNWVHGRELEHRRGIG